LSGEAMPARKSFLLRLSPELYDELQAWAEQELRSVNGQIEFILRGAVKGRRGRDVDHRKNKTAGPDRGEQGRGTGA
jgi:hypothetical protein